MQTCAAAGLSAGARAARGVTPGRVPASPAERYARLDTAAARPVIDLTGLDEPLIIDRIELQRRGREIVCRVTTEDGRVGLSVGNGSQLRSVASAMTHRIVPFFDGQRRDARQWERWVDELYIARSNYKFQGLALWIPLATLEFAVLDLLGRARGVPIARLLGPVVNPTVAVYKANNHRGKTPEESLDLIRANFERFPTEAIKFKVGGRMSITEDPPDRSERLIPMVRDTFGDDVTLYADSNGSYAVAEAVRIGRMLEAHGYGFFEEPVPFDHYPELVEVADALAVPIAGGEQEPSSRNFRWMLGAGGLDVVQPDLFYFGGFVRSLRVARMAEALGRPCVPHISGWGLGYLYMLHFVAALPNAGPYHEFKGFNDGIPFVGDTPAVRLEGGRLTVPTAPGLGVEIEPDYLAEFAPLGA
ncbi:MAG: mandelate racemase/muconate lactonizing enzyme family protein [Planctomycetota bacterium]